MTEYFIHVIVYIIEVPMYWHSLRIRFLFIGNIIKIGNYVLQLKQVAILEISNITFYAFYNFWIKNSETIIIFEKIIAFCQFTLFGLRNDTRKA